MDDQLLADPLAQHQFALAQQRAILAYRYHKLLNEVVAARDSCRACDREIRRRERVLLDRESRIATASPQDHAGPWEAPPADGRQMPSMPSLARGDGGASCSSKHLRTEPEPRAARAAEPCPLLALPSAMLSVITGMLSRDDELAVALSCRELCEAVTVSARQLRGKKKGEGTRTSFRHLINGSLALLQWGIACGAPLEPALCSCAARWFKLDKLQWLRSIGCPWDENTCASATINLGILRWVRENGCPWDKGVLTAAIRHALPRSREVVQWLLENGCPRPADGCQSAARFDRLEHLQLLRANGFAWDERVCADAAECGHLELLKWAHANGCPWDKTTCELAAESGQLEVLEWARASGCPWEKLTCAVAAMAGRLNVLQWLRANGCPWDADTCCLAALRGHLDTLVWARANGCPWIELVLVHAVERRRVDVLRWAYANGCPCDSDQACTTAAKFGHVDILEWAREHGLPWSATTYKAAADRYERTGDEGVLRFCTEHGCPGSSPEG
jgi:hypothetical protein